MITTFENNCDLSDNEDSANYGENDVSQSDAEYKCVDMTADEAYLTLATLNKSKIGEYVTSKRKMTYFDRFVGIV